MQVKTASEKRWTGFTTWIQGGSKNEEEEEEEEENEEKEVVVDDEEPSPAPKPAQSGLPKPAGGHYGALGGDTTATKSKPQPAKQQWDDDDWGDWGWGDSNGTSKKDS